MGKIYQLIAGGNGIDNGNIVLFFCASDSGGNHLLYIPEEDTMDCATML